MNSISISGNLTKDAESRAMSTGETVASFGIADTQARDKPTIFWNCSLFGKRGESLLPYLKKGLALTVIGSVSEREWTDKEGNKRKSMDVRVVDVALQGARKDAPELAPAKTELSAVPGKPYHENTFMGDVPF